MHQRARIRLSLSFRDATYACLDHVNQSLNLTSTYAVAYEAGSLSLEMLHEQENGITTGDIVCH